MKSMKAMKAAMKKMSMRRMKRAMKVSKIGRGRYAKASVFKGSKVKTSGGLKKTDLIKNKRGKVVGKKTQAAGKKAYKHVAKWMGAVVKARKALGVKGFVAVGGKTKQGQAILAKARSFYKK